MGLGAERSGPARSVSEPEQEEGWFDTGGRGTATDNVGKRGKSRRMSDAYLSDAGRFRGIAGHVGLRHVVIHGRAATPGMRCRDRAAMTGPSY